MGVVARLSSVAILILPAAFHLSDEKAKMFSESTLIIA
jgi:hypothetical protein